MTRGGRRDREGGFTLLEMMVAVAVLAALVAVIPRSFVQARANFDRSQDWLRARLVAEALLNEELSGMSLKAGTRSGTLEDRRWRITLEPNLAAMPRDNESGLVLLDVTVQVAMAGSDLEVSTMRIGYAE